MEGSSSFINDSQKIATAQPLAGVRVTPSKNIARQVTSYSVNKDFESLLKGSCAKEFGKIKNNHIIQTSFEDLQAESPTASASNGFMNSVVRAYNQHHHLVLRPEDVWFAILVQVNIYINAHAEELREMFVAHEGQKELQLVVGSDPMVAKKGSMFGICWASFAYLIGKKIEENIIDPSLRTWFMPTFSTTTKTDQATASIIMMSSMKKYFEYSCHTRCGLPSVTLLGRKRDWEDILSRLDRLKTFGDEPARFCDLLVPIAKKFVETFDDPDGDSVKDFWSRVIQKSRNGSGPTYLSGWITAFAFWDVDGKCLCPSESEMASRLKFSPSTALVIDGMMYYNVNTEKIPPGYASVPVLLDDNGVKYSAEMLAGSWGMNLSSSGLECEEGEVGLDTVQPHTGWCMYEVHSKEEIEAKRGPKVMKRFRRN